MPKHYFNISFFEFFLELSLNNQKSWFDENRKRYENAWLLAGPIYCLNKGIQYVDYNEAQRQIK